MRSKEFYYTNEQMVRDLLTIIPYDENDVLLDAGSGQNKVWYNNFKCRNKYACEIENGCDFYLMNTRFDWVIGNPPFHESWRFFKKASEITNKGIAFLINNQAFNSMTPKRFELLKERGFYLQKIHIVSDARWFGRYYCLIFTKEKNNFISWELKTYEEK